MENFFIEENFFMDLDSLISHLDLDDDKSIEELEDDWSTEAELSNLEPIFQFNEKFLIDLIMENTDKWADRWPEDDEDITAIQVRKAVKENINLTKLNEDLPKLYYPTGQFEEITKQDLLEYIK